MTIKYAVPVVVLALVIGSAVAGEVDYHKCAMCKPMTSEPGLMEHMKWENHAIATGMLSVTKVDAEYEQAYARAYEKMMGVVEKLETGEQLPLCPFCRKMNELAMAGAEFENIEGEGTHILAVTSENPEVIEKIHGYVKWVEKELAAQQQAG